MKLNILWLVALQQYYMEPQEQPNARPKDLLDLEELEKILAIKKNGPK